MDTGVKSAEARLLGCRSIDHRANSHSREEVEAKKFYRLRHANLDIIGQVQRVCVCVCVCACAASCPGGWNIYDSTAPTVRYPVIGQASLNIRII